MDEDAHLYRPYDSKNKTGERLRSIYSTLSWGYRNPKYANTTAMPAKTRVSP